MSATAQTPTHALRLWLYGVCVSDVPLASLAPGGVSDTVAPETVTQRHVRITTVSPGIETLTDDGRYVLTRALYQITGIAQSQNFNAVADIQGRLEALFRRRAGDRDGYHIEVWQTATVEPPPTQENSKWYRQAGVELGAIVHPA